MGYAFVVSSLTLLFMAACTQRGPVPVATSTSLLTIS